MKTTALKWEIWGFLFIILLGSGLHFAFELSGNTPWVGAFAAVNESVWEHLKLTFWPSILWAVLEFPRLRRTTHNFWWAKAIALYLMPIIITVCFYTYTAFTGHSMLPVDITIFAVAVALGQYVSFRMLAVNVKAARLNCLGLLLILLLGVAYVAFTYLPPHVGLFREEFSGRYGISGS
jgi:hypothetical protein